MGLGVYLKYANGKLAEVKSHQYGSTIAIGRSTTADCTITYNYSKFYWEVFGKSLADVLEGQKAKDTIPLLEEAIKELGTEPSGNYWDATKGNAGLALTWLLSWAKQHPRLHWSVWR